MTYKVLQPYSDWMLMNRGEIRPEVGDNYIKVNDYFPKRTVKHFRQLDTNVKCLTHFVSNSENPDYHDILEWDCISRCYVEIDYNPNEVNDRLEEFREITNRRFDESSSKLAIEFANWILTRFGSSNQSQKMAFYGYEDEKDYTVEEIYQQFKKQINGKQ